MKSLVLFFLFFLPIFLVAQINENFSDGDFILNPEWKGVDSNFVVNSDKQLQSIADSTSVSYLLTPSESFNNAVWECWVKINYATSSSNYASIILASDRLDISDGYNGYYVQIGGTPDEVSLYLKQGGRKTKIIDGNNKRTDGKPVEINIRVTRDSLGHLKLYSKLASETKFYLEGETLDTIIKNSKYFGLLYSNSSKTGSDYYFDNIRVTGEKIRDLEKPDWLSLNLHQPDTLQLQFTEPVDINNADFELNGYNQHPDKILLAGNKNFVDLIYKDLFQKGVLYTLYVSGITDLSGNEMNTCQKSTGIFENAEPADLKWNEVMFDNPDHSYEYAEVYNASNKLIDLSKIHFTTRKIDGSLNTLNNISEGNYILPDGYVAFTENADSVKIFHQCPDDANVISTDWSPLNNESATLVLCNETEDTIYDELTYNANWHSVLVKDRKGVALEKINPLMETNDPSSWHSASTITNYGTPGYKNSEFRELNSLSDETFFVKTDPKAFSPDNDGVDDVCMIRYRTDSPGYVANVAIYNLNGAKVCQLGSGILLSTSGSLIWDGKTDKGQNINAGIYVIYFESFNPETGHKMNEKLPIVVSYR